MMNAHPVTLLIFESLTPKHNYALVLKVIMKMLAFYVKSVSILVSPV
jgi:hypothetical protein